MQKIDFYCRNCRHTLRVSYYLTGNDETLVLERMEFTCDRCKSVARIKGYSEGFISKKLDKMNRFFV